MNIWQMSLQAGLLIIAIIIIRAVALHKLPKTVFLILWGVVLVRLLVPLSVTSLFSLYGFIDDTEIMTVVEYISPPRETPPVGLYPMNPKPNLTHEMPETIETAAGSHTPQIEVIEEASAFTLPFAWQSIVWVSGSVLVLVFFAVSYRRNTRGLQSARLLHSHPGIEEWKRIHPLRRRLSITLSDSINTPLTVGTLRPQIVLPGSMNLDDEALLQYVLTHEYYHIKRFDAVWKLLTAAALCLHWFNPLVWVMFILSSRDLEITCDELVVRHFGTSSKKQYAYSLLKMAEQQSLFAQMQSGFSKNAAEERIVSIMKLKKASVIGIILSAILVIVITVVLTTSKGEEPSGIMDGLEPATTITQNDPEKADEEEVEIFMDVTLEADNFSEMLVDDVTDFIMEKSTLVSKAYEGIKWVVNPLISEGEQIYILRNFSDDYLETFEYTTIDNPPITLEQKVIEVYDQKDLSAPVKTIAIKDEGNVYYDEMAHDANRIFLFRSRATEENPDLYAFYCDVFDNEGNLTNSYKLPKSDAIDKAVVYGDLLFYTGEGLFSGNKYKVFCLDLSSGEVKRFTNYTYTGMCRYDDDYIMFLGYPKANLSVPIRLTLYNPKTGEIKIHREYNHEVDINNISMFFLAGQRDIEYDAAANELYICMNQGIVSVNLESGEVKRLYRETREWHFTTNILLFDKYLLLTDSEAKIQAFNYTALTPQVKETITILAPSNGFIDPTFAENYYRIANNRLIEEGTIYEFKIVSPTSYKEYPEWLAKKLMAGDTDFDMFFLNETNYKMLQPRYFTDLTENAELAARFSDMMPGVKDLAIIDGKLALIPFGIYFNGYMYTRETAENAGFSLPIHPESLNEFYDFVYANTTAVANANLEMFHPMGPSKFAADYFTAFASNFMVRETGADKAALAELIDTLVKFAAEDIYTYQSENWRLSLLRESSAGNVLLIDEEAFALPKYSPAAKSPAQCSFFGVNPNSANKANVFKFFNRALDKDIFAGGATFLKSRDWYHLGETLYDYDFLDDNVDFQYYKEMLADSIRMAHDVDLVSKFTLDFESCLAGELTKDELVDRTFHALEMARDE